jgi:hypothetical protein
VPSLDRKKRRKMLDYWHSVGLIPVKNGCLWLAFQGSKRWCNSKYLCITNVDCGLFSWSPEVRRNISHNGKETTSAMQLLLIDYLIELCYNLAIPPTTNISESSSFQKFLVSYLKNDNDTNWWKVAKKL